MGGDQISWYMGVAISGKGPGMPPRVRPISLSNGELRGVYMILV